MDFLNRGKYDFVDRPQDFPNVIDEPIGISIVYSVHGNIFGKLTLKTPPHNAMLSLVPFASNYGISGNGLDFCSVKYWDKLCCTKNEMILN